NGPTDPGVDGTEMPMTSSPWSNSAPANPTGRSNAANAIQNEAAFTSQSVADQAATAAMRDGERRTMSPWRTPSISATIRSASACAGTTRRTTLSAASGNATTAAAPASAIAQTIAAVVAAPATLTPATVIPDGSPAAPSPMTSRAITVMPSNTRSTATELNA